MLNLKQYRDSYDRLADHLPWVALIAPGVILNKDGSFQRTLRYCGPDLESATPSELISVSSRANNILRRLGSGWAIFFEADRGQAVGYPDPGSETGIAQLIDEERRAAFEGQTGQTFESRFFLTLVYLPGPDAVASLGEALVDQADTEVSHRDWRSEAARFISQTDSLADMFAAFMPYVQALDDVETLTYLHGTISTKRHQVTPPATPMYLDGL